MSVTPSGPAVMTRVHRALGARLAGDPQGGNVLIALVTIIVLTMVALIFVSNAWGSTSKARDSRDFVVAGQLSRLSWQDGMYALNNDTSVPRFTGTAAAMTFFSTWSGGRRDKCADPTADFKTNRATWLTQAAANGYTAAKATDVSFGSSAKTDTAQRCWTLQMGADGKTIELKGVGWFNGSRRQSIAALGAVNISSEGTSANLTNPDGSPLVGYSSSPSTAWGTFSLFAATNAGAGSAGGASTGSALKVARLRNAAPAAGPVTVASNGRVSIAAVNATGANATTSATLFNGYRNLICDTTNAVGSNPATCSISARVGGLMSLDQPSIERHAAAMCGPTPSGGFPVWKASEAARRDGGGAGQLVATPGTAVTGGVNGSAGIGTVYCFSKMIFDAPYTLSGSGLANAYVIPAASTSTTQDCPYPAATPVAGHTPNPNTDAVVFCDGSALSTASGANLDVVVTGNSSVWVDAGASNLSNFYLLAPGSACTASTASTLTLNGSLACASIDLNEVYATPRPATAEALTYKSYLDNLYQRSGWYPIGYQEAVK